MRRQLKLKVLVELLGAILLLGAGLFLVHILQVRRHAADLLARAGRAEEQGEATEAIKYLDRYLTLKPDDNNALARFALVLARQADSPDARKRAQGVLARVLQRSPDRTDLRRWSVTLAMDLGQFANAREHLTVLLQDSPRDGELEHLRGECEQAEGDSANAVTWFTRAIAHAPDRIESYVRFAGLLRGPLKEPEQADQVMNNLVEANAGSAEAYLARARYRQETQALEEASKDLARARELVPTHVGVLLASGQLAAAQGAFAEARTYLRRGLELQPDHAPFYVSLASVEQHAGQHKEAIACLRRGLQAVPATARQGLLLPLLNVLLQDRQVAEAEEVLNQFRKEGPAPLAEFFQARILVEKGQWSGALSILQRVRPQLARSQELGVSTSLFLAECYEKLGDPEQQLTALQKAAAHDERSVPARWELGSALLARGDGAAAASEFRQLMTLHGAPAAGWSLLARAALLRNLRLPPQERDWGEMAQALERASRANPEDTTVPILRSQALEAQGQADRARQVLEEARAKHSAKVDLWVALIDWAERQGERKTADALLEEARQKLGDRVELRLARLRAVSRRGGAATRPELARLELGLEKCPAADQERLLGPLAAAYLRIGEVGKAERLWNQLAGRQPNNLGVRLLLFDLAVQTGEEKEVQRLLKEIKGIEGETGTWWRYGEVVHLIALAKKGRKEGLDQAGTYLTEVAKQRRDWSRVRVAEAEIQELQGHPDEALDKYQQAVELGDRQPVVIQRLVLLLYERQRFQEADQVIRSLQEQAPLPEGLRQLAVDLALKSRDARRALSLAWQAVTEQPTDPRNHVWLGLSLWAVGEQAEAEASLRRAVAIDERVPESWVALVQFLAGTGQADKAEAATKEAEQKLPPAPAPLALAQCYEFLGEGDQAEKHFRAALAARPDDPAVLRGAAAFYLRAGQAQRAEPPLRKLSDSAGRASAGDVAWARRNLAVEVLARGDYRQFRGALALLESNRPVNQRESVEDQLARALVLASRPCYQVEAISELKELGVRRPLAADNQFLLVRLYEARGNWVAADSSMESLLATSGDDGRYLAHHVRSKLRRKDAAGAQRWLEKLVRLYPRTWEATELQGRMLQAQGRGPEAVSLLLKFLQPGSGKPAEVEATGRVVALLEELGQVAAAEKLYREPGAWSKRPESLLLFSRFLGRQKRISEALDLCERAWPTCPPGAVAGTSVALLRAGPASPEHLARVERRLKAALQANPGMPALLMSLADCWDLQGRYEEAERLYRRVVEKEPDNIAALNDLAWLLAIRNGASGEALNVINHAIDCGGPEATLLDTRAVVHLAAGRIEPALDDLRQALEQQGDPAFHFHCALAHVRNKDNTTAEEDLQKAKAAGLASATLHPLERTAYQQLLAELDRK
jgi:tetratricopeptide (TPR) repeat protein